MIKKLFIYLFISIYFLSIFNINIYASNMNSYLDNMEYIFNDENLKQEYFKLLSEMEVSLESLGLTVEEKQFLERIKDEEFYYISNNTSSVGFIDEKYYTIEALIVNQINRVLKTNIRMISREDTQLASLSNVAEFIKNNNNFFSSIYTFDINRNINDDFVTSQFYANKYLFIVSHDIDLIDKFDEKMLSGESFQKIAVSDELKNVGDLLDYEFDNYMFLTPETAKEKLEKREIDYYICEVNSIVTATEKSNLQYKFFKSNVISISSAMSMFYTSAENEHFISIVDKIFNKIDKSILREYYYLYKHYKSSYIFKNSLTDEELAYIESLGHINVGIYDLKYLTEIKGRKVFGYTADTLEFFSRLINVEMEYIDITDDNYITLFIENDIDILPYMLETNAKEIYKDFKDINMDIGISNFYIDRKFEILKQMDTEDITDLDKLMYVDIGTLEFLEQSVQYYIKESMGIDELEYKTYKTMDEMVEALKSGEIKYALTTPGSSAYYEKQFSINERIQLAYDVSININEKNFKWVMLVSKGEETEMLVNILNKAFQVIDTYSLSNYWFDYSLNYENFEQLKRSNKRTTITISGFGILGLLFIFILVNRNIKSARDMAEIAKIDNLTKLYNKEALFENMVNSKKYFAILIDIKNFKNINEVYGIIIADEVLVSVANILRDIQKTQVEYSVKPYRLDKDEFILIIENTYGFKEQDFLIWLSNRLKETITIKKLTFDLEYSISAISSDYAHNNFKQALIFINNMKVKNKSNSKVAFVIFDDKEQEEIREYIEIEKALYNVTEDNILPFFQPFIDVKTGAVKGCEVLARLYLNETIYAPFRFIPLAERNGLLDDIDRLLFRRTLAIRSQLLKQGIIDEDFYFSLNISAQFLKELSIEYLDNIMIEFRLKDFRFMQMEVLEEKLTDEEAKKIFEIVSAKNIKSAVDDFSTGYSSLSRLVKNFKFKVLKIDKSLLPLRMSEKDKSVYRAIVEVVKKLDMSIVSEGVETHEHAEFLKTIDIDTFQGYYFSKPIPLEEFRQYIVISNKNNYR